MQHRAIQQDQDELIKMEASYRMFAARLGEPSLSSYECAVIKAALCELLSLMQTKTQDIQRRIRQLRL